jgi:hypothetical protein
VETTRYEWSVWENVWFIESYKLYSNF